MNERGDVTPPSYPAGQTAPPLVEQTRQKAGEVIDQARQQIRSQFAEKKESAAAGLGQVAQALRQTGQQLREHEQGAFSPYAEQAADQVERFSGYLREQDIERLVREAETLARRQPALFLGSAFMLGFFLSRFLKSSSDGAAAGSGAHPAWDRATWERSAWNTSPAPGTPTAMPQSVAAAGVMGASSSAMATGAAMDASSGMGTSGGMTSSPAASPPPGASRPAEWSAARSAEEEEEADLAPTAGQSGQGGLTDDE